MVDSNTSFFHIYSFGSVLLAAAITAAASTIGPIIPPSIPMVMYALISDTSIGYLFLGGFIPGIMMGIALMLLNARMARQQNVPLEEPVSRKELPGLTLRAFPALMMPVILLYGIYGGATTPTEAAAIAALYALVLATFFYRAVSLRTLYGVFLESGRATASVGLVIGAALIFNYIVASENVPAQVSHLMQGLNVRPSCSCWPSTSCSSSWGACSTRPRSSSSSSRSSFPPAGR